ncbi:MAG: glycerate kinase [Pyrinomonadaceae bacterium]
MNNASDLKQLARAIFAAALQDVDAGRALRTVLQLAGPRLTVVADEFDLDARAGVYAVAIGKAAGAMASAFDDVIGPRLTRGVVSALPTPAPLSARWQVFAGGHPLPNEASLAAGRAAHALLQAANQPGALVLFLISGGGSAMMELPRNRRVALADLRATNQALVSCGATIAEINAVRRALSAIKGGGLAALAPAAAQVSLIVSDTNPQAAAQVASGPTYTRAQTGDATQHIAAILERYQLRRQLPAPVLRALDEAQLKTSAHDDDAQMSGALRRHHVLLDNEHAQAAAATAARARGFAVELCADLIEAPVEVGCRELVARLLRLRRQATDGRGVCLISGGEFVCPVRGDGTGGRNLEAALRCALEFAEHADEIARAGWRVAALHAGTDGVDGNSPAAGACADETTIARAHALGLDAADYLARSDAYNFFRPLGNIIQTGPTGTNVRDLRILLAS